MICDDTTYTSEYTVFSIEILEIGWIYNVWIDLGYVCVQAEYCGKVIRKNGRYSIFRVIHVFDFPMSNQLAYFHYYIEGKEYVTDPIRYDVENFYDG